MVEITLTRSDIYDAARTLSMLQKRIRRVYTTTQNNETVQRGITTFIQPMLEVRYAWEHFSDALLDTNDAWNADPDMFTAEMVAARSHMLRCYRDLTEWRFLQVKIYTKKITKRLTREEIESAMPGYYSAVFPLYEKVEKTLVEPKEATEREFDDSVALLDQANEICETILAALNENALVELRRKSASNLLFSAMKFLGAVAAGTLITLLIQYLLQLAA